MTTITFATKLTEDGSFVIPREAIQELDLHPGDAIRVRLETARDAPSQEEYEQRIAALLEEAKSLQTETGKPSGDPHEMAFGEILKEKYRKQGFKL